MNRRKIANIYCCEPILFICGLLVSCMSFISCGGKDEPKIPISTENRDLTVLLYAVASNDLESYLESDKKEILSGVNNTDMRGMCMLVYQVTSHGDPLLLEVVKENDGAYVYKELKSYDRSLYSTDPRRISEVIEDVKEFREADDYGLILWSHGTGLDPSFSDHGEVSLSDLGRIEPEMCFSFGADKDSSKNPYYTDAIDIDELASSLPDDMFHFIWFDACYMSGIETLYELKNKCKYFVGYPTEVFSPGMPYNLTVPYFLQKNPDLQGGAEAFFNYYDKNPDSQLQVATVCVADMSEIESVADACKKIYSGATSTPSTDGLICYTRKKVGPFYDFGQYTLRCGSERNEDYISEFDNAMKRFVIWCAATDVDFNYHSIDKSEYSGLSCYIYDPASVADKMTYYRSLSWYKRVYE